MTKVLKYLVERYGTDLSLPSWGDRHFVSVFARKAELSAGTVRSLKEGNSSDVKDKTADRLAKLFRRVVPHIEADWFRNVSSTDFIARLESHPLDKKLIALEIPAAGYKRFDLLRQWLCGVYVCYRYSFERSEERLVAREILHIWEQNESFRFRMSFVPGGDEVGQRTGVFQGVALPLGESFFFVGWNEDRGRSLFINTDFSSEARDCRIGILSSTRLSSNRAPLAACTLLIKCQVLPDEIGQFMQETTKSAPFDQMIEGDFGGKSAREWIGKFLRNGPHAEADGHSKPDTVLRLDLYRFSAEMPPIYRVAMNNSKINAPFKPDWKPNSASG